MAKIWRVRVAIPREGGHTLDEYSAPMSREAAEDAEKHYVGLGLACEIEAMHVTAKLSGKSVVTDRTTIKMVKREPEKGEFLLYKIGTWNIVANKPVQLPESDVADKLSQVIIRMLKKR